MTTTRSVFKRSVASLTQDERRHGERFVDMQLAMTSWETGQRLLTVGGIWDKRAKRYVGNAPTEHTIALQPAQMDAAPWLCEWFARFAASRHAAEPAAAWADFDRAWSVLFHGGRRGGKSHLACVALAAFAVMVPGTTCWAVSPTEERTEELRAAIASVLPRAWYRYSKDKLVFRLVNHAQIIQRSGHKAENLKAGGVGLALYNEGQQMNEKGYLQLRGATADSGSLTIVTANPPDRPIGRWVEQYAEEVRSGKRRSARTFFFDWRKNPFIERASLEDMADETDDTTFRREILGEFVPIGDVVFHAWSDRASIREVPDGFRDTTRAFTKRMLGREFDHVVGCDFDKVPHLAGAVIKVFEKPTELDDVAELAEIPSGVPLYWVVDEAIVELSDEDGLIDALEDLCLDPRCTAVIADASGDYQDVERTRGRGSWDWFRSRGWRYLFYPDPNMKRNPNIIERCKAGNALLKSHTGKRRLFSLPRNEHVNRAMKLWELEYMAPYRRSTWAHACDAVTYPCWRFEGRRRQRSKAEYKSVKRFSRRRLFRGI